MTKSEVRAVSLSKLELVPGAVLWDIGAGTGSVSVEAARFFSQAKAAGEIWAVEKEAEGIRLIRENKERLAAGFSRFHVIEGKAPECLEGLPAPSHVFIGGSGGSLKKILAAAFGKNPKARIVVNAITAETLIQCMEAVREQSLSDYEAVQVAVSRFEKAGQYHLQKAQNPVFIILLQG